MSHPAAFIEYRVRHRVRTRIHVEPHPVLSDHVSLTFGDADADVEISLNLEETQRLIDGLTGRLDMARQQLGIEVAS